MCQHSQLLQGFFSWSNNFLASVFLSLSIHRIYWGLMNSFARFFLFGKNQTYYSAVLVYSFWVAHWGSESFCITFWRVSVSTGVIKVNCRGASTVKSTIGVFVLIVGCNWCFWLTLTAIFLSVMVDIVCEFSNRVDPVKLFSRLTVPVLFNF